MKKVNLLADGSVEQLQERWRVGNLFPEIQVERVFLTGFQPLGVVLETPRRLPLVDVNVVTLIHAAEKVEIKFDEQKRVQHQLFPYPFICETKVRDWLDPIRHRSHHVPLFLANFLKHRSESLPSHKSQLSPRQRVDLAILCSNLVG